jgi:hypothetical protein
MALSNPGRLVWNGSCGSTWEELSRQLAVYRKVDPKAETLRSWKRHCAAYAFDERREGRKAKRAADELEAQARREARALDRELQVAARKAAHEADKVRRAEERAAERAQEASDRATAKANKAWRRWLYRVVCPDNPGDTIQQALVAGIVTDAEADELYSKWSRIQASRDVLQSNWV